jgi:hypothetical protein
MQTYLLSCCNREIIFCLKKMIGAISIRRMKLKWKLFVYFGKRLKNYKTCDIPMRINCAILNADLSFLSLLKETLKHLNQTSVRNGTCLSFLNSHLTPSTVWFWEHFSGIHVLNTTTTAKCRYDVHVFKYFNKTIVI